MRVVQFRNKIAPVNETGISSLLIKSILGTNCTNCCKSKRVSYKDKITGDCKFNTFATKLGE